MLKMRLQRVGRRNHPSYRVLVVDSRQGPKSGSFVARIGSYDPRTKATTLDAEAARAWIAKGVQPSDTVHNLLVSQKVIEGKKVNALPKKSPIKKEGGEAEATSEAAPEAAADASAEETAPESAASGEGEGDAAPAAEEPAAEEAPAEEETVKIA